MSVTDLHKYAGLLRGYTELRVQENKSTRISFVKGNNTTNSRSSSYGVSARVYRNGSWGLASNPRVSDETIKWVVNKATENAAFLDARESKGQPPLPSSPASLEKDFSTKKTRLSQKEILEFVKEVDEQVAGSYPDLSSRTVSLACLDMEKTLLTSDGSYAYSLIPRSFLYVGLTVEQDGRPVELGEPFGGLGQFEDLFSSPDDLSDGIAELYEHLMKKKEGIFPEAGRKTCVLDAELAGILAHEAIGHTIEADLVQAGSVAGGWIGKNVASPLITLVDFAHTALGETCPVPVYIDDEGTSAQDAVVIEDGVLRRFLHNKESAQRFGAEPLGNARAYSFSDEPLIRMRNTAILPGESNLEDMIASVDDGYYLIRPSNGEADSTSEFMFGVVLGYEINNGKLGKALRDTTISGVAYDVLKTVTMVSNEIKWLSAGMCGKKQPIPVGLGGPAIKCQVSLGGR